MVLADPLGSGLASYASTGTLPEKMTPWLVEGIGGDSVPPVADFSRVAQRLQHSRCGSVSHLPRAA